MNIHQCEISSESTERNRLLCDQIYEAINCRTTLTSPTQYTANIRITSRESIKFNLQCGWIPSNSQYKIVCFTFICALCAYCSIIIARKHRKKIKNAIIAHAILIVLLFYNAIFDYIIIKAAKEGNEGVCRNSGTLKIKEDMVVMCMIRMA